MRTLLYAVCVVAVGAYTAHSDNRSLSITQPTSEFSYDYPATKGLLATNYKAKRNSSRHARMPYNLDLREAPDPYDEPLKNLTCFNASWIHNSAATSPRYQQTRAIDKFCSKLFKEKARLPPTSSEIWGKITHTFRWRDGEEDYIFDLRVACDLPSKPKCDFDFAGTKGTGFMACTKALNKVANECCVDVKDCTTAWSKRFGALAVLAGYTWTINRREFEPEGKYPGLPPSWAETVKCYSAPDGYRYNISGYTAELKQIEEQFCGQSKKLRVGEPPVTYNTLSLTFEAKAHTWEEDNWCTEDYVQLGDKHLKPACEQAVSLIAHKEGFCHKAGGEISNYQCVKWSLRWKS